MSHSTSHMDPVSKNRYITKISTVNGLDPYDLDPSKWDRNYENLPKITYPDIFNFNYLVLKTSFYTADSFKAYKGLCAYNQANNGWVKEVCSYKQPRCKNVIVSAKVCHSQRVNEKPLWPWAIVQEDGEVLSGHCNCMAGLGETCTHVSALLFFVETFHRLNESKTVTAVPAYWRPCSGKNVVPDVANNIDFISPKQQRKRQAAEENVCNPKKKCTKKLTKCASQEERDNLFKALSDSNQKSAILSVLPKVQDKFVHTKFTAKSLSSLKDLSKSTLPYEQLIDHCAQLDLSVTQSEVNAVEKQTRSQHKCKLWFKLREGRVTASKLHAVCSTSLDNPSLSLIKSIVQPTSISVPAVQWGLDKEEEAKRKYLKTISAYHKDSVVLPCGLFISRHHPFLAATPDGIVSCVCCGRGCLEIKCPYTARHMTIKEGVDSISNFCLAVDEMDHKFKLKTKHPYFKQIQCQMFVTETKYCDFCVWTDKDFFVQRIYFDLQFISKFVDQARLFFTRVILPEVVTGHFSRSNTLKPSSVTADSIPSDQSYCSCSKPKEGQMICCSNENCSIHWFHYECVGLKREPKGKWYCLKCRPQRIGKAMP